MNMFERLKTDSLEAENGANFEKGLKTRIIRWANQAKARGLKDVYSHTSTAIKRWNCLKSLENMYKTVTRPEASNKVLKLFFW